MHACSVQRSKEGLLSNMQKNVLKNVLHYLRFGLSLTFYRIMLQSLPVSEWRQRLVELMLHSYKEGPVLMLCRHTVHVITTL